MVVSQPDLKTRQRLDARQLHRTYYNGGLEASLDFGPVDDTFTPTVWGMATDASSGGCGVVAIEPPGKVVAPGMKCRLQIEAIAPIEADVIWVERLDPASFKFGLRFSD